MPSILPAPASSVLRSWILTGGVACGKSAVLNLLRELLGPQVSVFSSDEAVHQLYQQPDLVRRIVARFGSDILVPGSTSEIDRRVLGEKVFGDASARADLEALLHPRVLEALEAARRLAAATPSVNLFVAEVPLYYEIGSTVAADHVIVVASSPALQVRRLMQHRGLNQARSEAILAAQWPVLEKAANASRVIWNDGDLRALEDQVAALTRFSNAP